MSGEDVKIIDDPSAWKALCDQQDADFIREGHIALHGSLEERRAAVARNSISGKPFIDPEIAYGGSDD